MAEKYPSLVSNQTNSQCAIGLFVNGEARENLRSNSGNLKVYLQKLKASSLIYSFFSLPISVDIMQSHPMKDSGKSLVLW